MRYTVITLAAATLPLAACNQDEVAPVDSQVTADATGDQSLADPAPDAVTAPASGSAASGEPAIPETMLGIWDGENGNCHPASDLRLDIKPRSIEFYESYGEITAITPAENGRIVDLAMEGEGEAWTQQTLLKLNETGDRLLLLDPAKQTTSNDIPRKRCPA